MKSEELRRYEEEFRAMREMLGTYCLELGRPAGEPEIATDGGEQDKTASSPGQDPRLNGDPAPPAQASSGGG